MVEIKDLKQAYSLPTLCSNLEAEICKKVVKFINVIESLGYSEEPNYNYLIELLYL
jgi:hypothetical protein